MKKKYEVVAYQTTRYIMNVEAENTKEAKKKAGGYNVVAWDHDYEFYDFKVMDVREVEDE